MNGIPGVLVRGGGGGLDETMTITKHDVTQYMIVFALA